MEESRPAFREAALRALWLTACLGLALGAASAADLTWEKTVSPVTGRIKPALALDCLSFETDPPSLAGFDRPAERVLSHYHAAQRLRNDQPAAGATVRIRFQIEE